jgi:methionyl-tRNA formyltransferase
MISKRIVFLGTPDISAFLLKGLIDSGFNVIGVVTKEDKVRGRNNKVEESPVAKMAHSLNIPVFKPHRLNKDFSFLNDLKPDLMLTFAYGQLISDEILKIPTLKPLNLHASLLPKYRGAAPIQYALRNGETETGVTLMEMVHEMDAGDIYGVIKTKIEPNDNYTSLSYKLASTALEVANKFLPLFFEGKLNHIAQDQKLATFCPSIKKEEEKLNLDVEPETFINQVRSLSLTPGGYLMNGNDELKIFEASKLNSSVTAPIGTILEVNKKNLVLQLGKGQVNILTLQRPGKRIMSAADFNNGVRDFKGVVLK